MQTTSTNARNNSSTAPTLISLLTVLLVLTACSPTSDDYTGAPLHNPSRIKSVVERVTSSFPGGWYMTEQPQQMWGLSTTDQAASDLIDSIHGQPRSIKDRPNNTALIYLFYGEIEARVNMLTGETKTYDSWVYIKTEIDNGVSGSRGGFSNGIEPQKLGFERIEIPTNLEEIPTLESKPAPYATSAPPATPQPTATIIYPTPTRTPVVPTVAKPTATQTAFNSLWKSADGKYVNRQTIVSHAGLAHCDWQSATFLLLAWPLGSVASSSSDQFQFVKDPNQVVYGPPERFQTTYESNIQLPEDAYFSGYSKSGVELWISDLKIGEGIYMVNENQRVEKWPRTEPKFLCY